MFTLYIVSINELSVKINILVSETRCIIICPSCKHFYEQQFRQSVEKRSEREIFLFNSNIEKALSIFFYRNEKPKVGLHVQFYLFHCFY
jgi:hypothetical protein